MQQPSRNESQSAYAKSITRSRRRSRRRIVNAACNKDNELVSKTTNKRPTGAEDLFKSADLAATAVSDMLQQHMPRRGRPGSAEQASQPADFLCTMTRWQHPRLIRRPWKTDTDPERTQAGRGPDSESAAGDLREAADEMTPATRSTMVRARRAEWTGLAFQSVDKSRPAKVPS